MSTVIFKDKEYKLYGKEVKIGDKISFKAADLDFNEVEINSFKKKITVLSIFPSINTSVCDLQTREISQLASQYPNIEFISISVDLPSALKQWCLAHGVDNVSVYSDYLHHDFGKKYGFLIEGLNLLTRGAMILDKKGEVVYEKKTKKVSDDIDFEELKWAIKQQIEKN